MQPGSRRRPIARGITPPITWGMTCVITSGITPGDYLGYLAASAGPAEAPFSRRTWGGCPIVPMSQRWTWGTSIPWRSCGWCRGVLMACPQPKRVERVGRIDGSPTRSIDAIESPNEMHQTDLIRSKIPSIFWKFSFSSRSGV